jgi:hypothetical protein
VNRWRRTVCTVLLAAGGAVCAGEVQAPHWGDVLFHVYQGNTFTAVTTLMASQQIGRLPHHGDEAEATRGGLLLAYGLHREAGAIFTRLAEQGSTPEMRDRAWFYLARIRWQRGLAADAEQALAQVARPLEGELEEERLLLAAQLRLTAGDARGAAALLTALAADGQATPYARFNLGVALVRSGDLAGGQTWLQGLGRTPAADEEQRALRDKANLALGFGALQAQQPAQARDHLQRVRLAGPSANKALLGFGWAAAALKQPRDALVPWQELLTRDPADPAVLEARLAVPYALAELQAFGQAHDGYQQAIALYTQESQALDGTISAVRSGSLVDSLLARNPGADLGWLWRVQDLPELPHPAHLAPLLASNAFQEALKDQRDLRFLQANLQRWAADLQIFDTMLANRRQAYADRLPQVREEARRADLAARAQRRAEVAAAIAQAESDADGVALANADEQALLQRLAQVRGVLSQSADDKSAERLRRVAGALTWQLAAQQTARAWEAKKSLRTIDAELASASTRDAALAQAQRDEPARFETFAKRIAALDQRIKALVPPLAALQRDQQQALQAMAVETLQSQQARLADYGAQAQFAAAQLQDRATLARSSDDATAR